MSKKKAKVLCPCYKCEKKEMSERYVDHSTKWRHLQKQKSNRYLNVNENNKLVLI